MLSIIIPTHRRPEILKKCLECIERQTIKGQLEVIVVSDDGEGPGARGQVPTKFINVPPCHQGVARNRGVTEAKGELCMFIGDDIFLAPDACEKHLLVTRNPQLVTPMAVLGFTTWDPAVGITPVMKWLEKSGWQFGYPMIEKFNHQVIPPSIQHRFTYTSHISLPTEIAKQFPFREDVTLYGWEDIEWGLRLAKANIPLFYESDAKALHHHHVTLEDSLKRMETLGKSAVVIEQINPDLHVVPRGWKSWAYAVRALLPTMAGQHAKAFLLGLHTPKNGVD